MKKRLKSDLDPKFFDDGDVGNQFPILTGEKKTNDSSLKTIIKSIIDPILHPKINK